jgi:L-ascorbate metabolism protein UlaG (beta-lactamase superfamily)
MAKQQPNLSVTWFGHSAFLLESPRGKKVLIDPWLDNPRAPAGAKDSVSADLILVSHGHSDHVGNTVDIAKRTGATVAVIYELHLYFQSHGVRTTGFNKGGTLTMDGVSITMVDAKHSGDLDVGTSVIPGGEAAGFVIRFENGFTVYHAGDTSVFGDMKLIGSLYKPHAALLPIGGLYTMDPLQAALACKLINPARYIIGMHYGTFPALTGTPADLKKKLPTPLRKKVLELLPGKAVSLV